MSLSYLTSGKMVHNCFRKFHPRLTVDGFDRCQPSSRTAFSLPRKLVDIYCSHLALVLPTFLRLNASELGILK